MTPYDYECIMVAAKFAEHHKTRSFIVKLTNLNAFLTPGHRFATCNSIVQFEVDKKKIDLNASINEVPPVCRVNCNFIRIGILAVHSPCKIEMQKYSDGRIIVTLPRLNGLRITQQSFRKCMEQYKWNHTLDTVVNTDMSQQFLPPTSSPLSPQTMTNTISIITPAPMAHKKMQTE